MREKILAIIPARGGSKGIPKKNLRKINGKTLVSRAVEFAALSNVFDEIICSTDSEEIAAEAQNSGAVHIAPRPKHLSGDKVSDAQVVRHEIKQAEKFFDANFNIIALLQPTSPIRKEQDLKSAINIMDDQNVDSVWSVSLVPLHYHPLKSLVCKGEASRLENYLATGRKIIARQELESTYIRNGVFYLFRPQVPFETDSLMGRECRPFVIDSDVINIDETEDLDRAKELLKKEEKND